VDYCPGNLYALIEKCWATNAVEHPQFPIICQYVVDFSLEEASESKDSVQVSFKMHC